MPWAVLWNREKQGQVMKISLIALCVLINAAEKQAISIAQQVPVSNLDAQLPNRPFVAWFNELVGRDAGIVWQLAECGASETGQDMPACAEVSVLLPTGNRMILAISVGTFKKGVTGQSALRSAAVDAAREWVYKPKTLNCIPTEVETVLTFTFAPGSQ